ncbi:M48 family metallopeptidase [Streptomyces sp. NP160]|uniref:M48 metallopeptidase family protein n=1 Tax=Streptomyces sp. NP160 TaxID=2586637 RepID=UPI0015D5C116|nr:M48 family metallopeptidase [Streptomyces sp. NP160]
MAAQGARAAGGDPVPTTARPVAHDLPPVEVRRSARRRRTVTAFRDGGTVVVCIPAGFTRAQERVWVDRMVTKLAAQDQRRRPSDEALARRAAELSARYLGGRARPSSVRWVANQTTRWGSTTTADGTIRLSDRLQGMPSWVVDYVLVHELAHLLEHGHGDRFWELVEAYPRTERARGYLEGFATARDLPIADVDDGADPAAQLPG